MIGGFDPGLGRRGAAAGGREGQERAEALEYTKWIGELMLEGGVRSLPRAPEVLGRVLDSRAFWGTIGNYFARESGRRKGGKWLAQVRRSGPCFAHTLAFKSLNGWLGRSERMTVAEITNSSSYNPSRSRSRMQQIRHSKHQSCSPISSCQRKAHLPLLVILPRPAVTVPVSAHLQQCPRMSLDGTVLLPPVINQYQCM